MMRAALTALALLLAAGCTTGPEYQRPELPLPATWRSGAGDDAELVNRAWWRAFADEQLDRLIDEAIDANQELVVAAARSRQFAARLGGAEAEKYPVIGYGAGAGRELRSEERPNGLRPGQSPLFSNFELGGSLSWELDLWGRVQRATEAARAELFASQEARRGVMLTVVSDVAAGYVRLLELDRQLLLVREKLKLRMDALALTDAKRQGGSATRLDVERLRAAVEEQAAAVPEIEREISSVELAMCSLLGRSPSPIERRRLDELALPQLPASVPADVLVRRPDVATAEQALVAANARIGVAKTAYFPTLSLSAALGLGADQLQWLFAETARTASLGAALAGTLFDGGRIKAAVREAEAGREVAQAEFVSSVQRALVEVEDALSTRSYADAREAVIDRQVASLEAVRGLVQARLDGGQTERIALFEADIALRDTEIARAQGRRDRLLALVAVYKAMGGGWMQEEERRRESAPNEVQAQTAAQVNRSEQPTQ